MSVTIKDLDGNTLHLTQWETDRVMLISGTETMPICRFASRWVKQALVVNGEEVETDDPSDDPAWTVKVPNFLLQYDGIIGVAVMAETDAGEVREIAMTNLKVIPRQKPQDYCYEDNIGYINWVDKSQEVQDLIDEIQEMLDNEDLKGDKGDPGDPGPAGQDGAPGQDGADGVGVPDGGTTGQYLRKASGTDYDTEWATLPKEVFWATYGTTTAAAIAAAIADDEVCLVKHTTNGLTKVYRLAIYNPNIAYTFIAADANGINTVTLNCSDDSWTANEYVEIPEPSSSTPANLGVASPGTSGYFARADHVHKKPTLSELGVHNVPAGGSSGYVLKKASGTDYDLEWAAESGGGGGVTVDDELSDSSTNPVQNKVIKAALDGKGTYSKPSGGIPDSDIASAATWNAKGSYSKPSGGIPKTDLASAVQTSLGKADSALQSYTETDPTVPSWAKASSKPSYTASEVGAIAAPSSPASGAFLVWNGSAWVAQTLSTWQASSY